MLAVLVLLLAALAVLLTARLYRQAVFVAAATLLSHGRERPHEAGVRATAAPSDPPDTPGSWSFPSGHTMSATGFAVALAIVLWPTRWRWPALVAAAGLRLGIGLTRIYLGRTLPLGRRRRLGAGRDRGRRHVARALELA